MKNFYAKQFQTGAEIKVHVFTSMQERDAWVKVHYDTLGARQCSAAEAMQLAKHESHFEH
jgi:hypothetical protein